GERAAAVDHQRRAGTADSLCGHLSGERGRTADQDPPDRAVTRYGVGPRAEGGDVIAARRAAGSAPAAGAGKISGAGRGTPVEQLGRGEVSDRRVDVDEPPKPAMVIDSASAPAAAPV